MTKEGKHYRFRNIEFWAERGLIQFVDERFPPEDDRSHDVLTVTEFLENIRAINRELGNIKHADERAEHDRLIENGIKCAKEAQNQGRPDDPEHVRQILKDRRKNWVMGTGNGKYGEVKLHTESASATPEGAMLPPMPKHPMADVDKPLALVLPSKRSLIIPGEHGG